MKRVLIFSDSRWRDSFGDALLAYKLNKLGIWAEVVSYDLWNVAASSFKPHLVLLNHLHGRRNTTIANRIKRNGGNVVVLPTEGRPNTDDIAKWFFSQLDSNLLDFMFVWSELDDPHEKAIITGHPRFEIYNYHKDLIESRESFRERYNLSMNKKVVGITTSFPQAKFALSRGEINEQDWKDLGMTSIPGRENPAEFAEAERKALLHFQTRILIEKYRGNIDAQYILKPHPMSDVGMWREFCYKHDIRLCSQDYIYNFLSGVDKLITRENCMTIIEGFLSEIEVTVMPDDGVPKVVSWSASDIEYYLGMSNFLSETAPSDLISEHIYNIVRDTETHESPTPFDISQLETAIRVHSANNIYPNNFDAHLGKAVTKSVINEWLQIFANKERAQ